MKDIKKLLGAFILLTGFYLTTTPLPVQAQKDFTNDTLSQAEADQYKEQAKQLIKFLESTFNILGNPTTDAREKDIIINKTFLKFFRDDEVQIEDDLDENREYTINKDVQAYLKDIDFFFKNVEFQFDVKEMELIYYEAKDLLYIKATVDRHLRGKTINNKMVSNNKNRFIEINIDRQNKDMKIASIYSKRISEAQTLRFWWNNLPQAWRDYFSKHIEIKDSINLDQLRDVKNTKELNLAHNKRITDLNPISGLTNLKKIDCSNTLVTSLLPLRNMLKLESLNCSGTQVESLEHLQYLTNLQEIDFSETKVTNVEPLMFIETLQKVVFQNTKIKTIRPLAALSGLNIINCSGTLVTDIKPLLQCKELTTVNISNTKIKDISVLSQLPKIVELRCHNTPIITIEPIKHLQLKKLYCYNTNITDEKTVINDFRKQNPECLVVYRPDELKDWWNDLSSSWKNVFKKMQKIVEAPTEEELHQIATSTIIYIAENKDIESLDALSQLSDLKQLYCYNTAITDLKPLSRLHQLEVLDCHNTAIAELAPLQNLKHLDTLIVGYTKIADLRALKALKGLSTIDIQHTQVSDLEPISELPSLKIVYCNDTPLASKEDAIVAFAALHPETLIIYRTRELRKWWKQLSIGWHKVFKTIVELNGEPTPEELHRIAGTQQLVIPEGIHIKDLQALTMLKMLKKLVCSKTQIANIDPVKELMYLEELDCSKNPIEDLLPIKNLANLHKLDCSDTQVDDLSPLENLRNLRELNCSGTQIGALGLNPVNGLSNLQYLDCFNTNIRLLNPLFNLPHLRRVRCYNTKIWKIHIEKFKKAQPDCEVIYY